MSDEERPFDSLHEAGECPEGGVHMIASKDGRPVGMTHMERLEEGRPIPPGRTVYYTDDDGHIVDTFRYGPAQVASPRYRDGWDAVFGKQKSDAN